VPQKLAERLSGGRKSAGNAHTRLGKLADQFTEGGIFAANGSDIIFAKRGKREHQRGSRSHEGFQVRFFGTSDLSRCAGFGWKMRVTSDARRIRHTAAVLGKCIGANFIPLVDFNQKFLSFEPPRTRRGELPAIQR
jgi:hypothetical protein